MFKVLIVDDDIIIRQYIKSLLKWDQYGYEVVGEEDNGANALKFISQNPVDLVITDIFMPIMDGVELIAKIKKNYPGVECLVLSNYDEFKYVKDAMKYGAFDYLLKFEVDAESLSAQLLLIKDKIHDKKTNNNIDKIQVLENKWKDALIQQFWESVLFGKYNAESMISDAVSIGIEVKGGCYVLLLADIEELNQRSQPSADKENEICNVLPSIVSDMSEVCKYSFAIGIGDGRWAIILRFREKGYGFLKNASIEIAKKLVEIFNKSFNVSMTIAVGDAIYTMDEFAGHYSKLEACLQCKFYWDFGKVIDASFFSGFKNEFTGGLMYGYMKKIVNSLKNSEAESIFTYIGGLFQEISAEKYAPELVYDYFTEMILSIKNVMEEKRMIMQYTSDINFLSNKEIRNFPTLEAIKEWFNNFINIILNSISEVNSISCRKEIKKVILLVRENYMKNITLEYAADYVGVSKNYFCTLFKDEIGTSFIEYVNKIRIEKAEALIHNSDKNMKEIAAAIGLDYGYFCKLFKEYKGKKPTELRNMKQMVTADDNL